MKPAVKAVLVSAGYVAAFLIASAAVAVRIKLTSGPDAQASSGMYACGDALLFLSVFSVAAILPTAAGLFFLRPYRLFWRVLSLIALAVALTGVAAIAVYLFGRTPGHSQAVIEWASLAVLRILVAPMLSIAFFLFCLFTPHRPARWAFLAATAMEVFVGACAAYLWFNPFRFH